MGSDAILIRGARQHNLQNIDVKIPRGKLVVITGISGSGKSSLAFDTIYAEGQRRYVESLSAYARQFLEQMEKPDVESIEGLTPTIAIEQRSGSANPRSIVATSTEIYDYLRVLFARVGTPHCHLCGREIARQTAEQMVESVLLRPAGARVMVLAGVVRGRKGEHREAFSRMRAEGFVRARVDGRVWPLENVPPLEKNIAHTVEAVVDRLVIRPEIRSRLTDSVETALRFGDGTMILAEEDGAANSASGEPRSEDTLYSEHFACVRCGVSLPEIEPRVFSFNSPYGACETCGGLGTKLELDPDLIVPDRALSLAEGAVEAWRRCGRQMNVHYWYVLREFADEFDADLETPYSKLTARQRKILLRGTPSGANPEFEGVIPDLWRRFQKTESDFVKRRIHEYMSALPCPACDGARLRPESLAVRVAGQNIHEVVAMTIEEALKFFTTLRLAGERARIAKQVLKEIRERLSFLVDVGLEYITLDRTAGTLAGGEAQRIRLGSQVGSRLGGVTYVLDEPTIGLHPRDNARLLATLRRLRDLGNTVIVVEHDAEMIRGSDYVIDLGPGAGRNGGRVVAQGSPRQVTRRRASLTGQYLAGTLAIPVPKPRRPVDPQLALRLKGARENNLKNIDVDFPLGVFICVTGVSGSGKSTLATEILYKALARKLHGAREKPGRHRRILGIEKIDKVVAIDQSPIGRTPRSNPATYTGVFDEIRHLFARLPEAKIRGYAPGRFSFNVRGGRCEACQGQGTKLIEMHFLPDVYVQCEQCGGRRYNRETIEVRYRGLNIAEVLALPISEALRLFRNIPARKRGRETLVDVGLGYVQLGQSSTTLSGGEAQRVKLSAELGRRETGSTLYVLDEPTTGLHFADISKLLDVLTRLVERGNTVIVIEHNLDVVKIADQIIDLGPGGGEAGGQVVATGTPEEIVAVRGSRTGEHLRRLLPSARRRRGAGGRAARRSGVRRRPGV